MKSIFLVVCFLVGCLITTTVQYGAAKPGKAEARGSIMDTVLVPDTDVKQMSYGKTASGDEVTLFTLTNANGFVLKMIDYGATVVSFEVPDRDGRLANVVLTCDGIEGFQACQMYFNGSVGRYCNRIAGGKFSIDGKTYQVAKNNGENHLHGGVKGFDKCMWKGAPFKNDGDVGVRFSLMSQDGDEGYPGNLDVTATYTLTANNEFVVEFRATTDKATHVNLTNHNYWNLAGKGNILDHEVTIHAAKFIPVDASGIPSEGLMAVAGTIFDFNAAKPIGKDLKKVDADPVGFDHCYVLDGVIGELRPAARVKDPSSGRVMEIMTTEPGLQFYTGNFLKGDVASGGYPQYSAFCMESEHYPDTPNHSDFPTTLLKPGEKYYHKTVHRFSSEK